MNTANPTRAITGYIESPQRTTWVANRLLRDFGSPAHASSLAFRSETRPANFPTVVRGRCLGGEHPHAEEGSFRCITGRTLTWSFWSFLGSPIMSDPARRQRQDDISFS